MVWIHGGGNLGGAGLEDAFDGNTLAKHTSKIKYVFGNLQPENHYDDIDIIISKQL
ncbi:hypothetical protein [Staphylococcus epidermidis]|uniref:hypothetical protein n=1 Tax=Staphylococcus epidermidis TaxID=1282 RepID=UPI000A693C75|nr:hypothetical protein [Staphylococcus epidermidis]MCA0116996.1 hypothetical protein [Staphylococcus epidermidis]MCG2569467.1 hypothetical protein [Staphylococcus epidermidis]TBW74590.1 hypothetical protein EQ807_12260 [Staphylococcus epidermidis]TBW82646.1 hypothetical protein EQ805_12150 [Staphylococcus epidermidis]TBW84264.1 hypothetical protein EQ806_12290 [Staphylococcus epidermidis]